MPYHSPSPEYANMRRVVADQIKDQMGYHLGRMNAQLPEDDQWDVGDLCDDLAGAALDGLVDTGYFVGRPITR